MSGQRLQTKCDYIHRRAEFELILIGGGNIYYDVVKYEGCLYYT
jgi:hypothetical protein